MKLKEDKPDAVAEISEMLNVQWLVAPLAFKIVILLDDLAHSEKDFFPWLTSRERAEADIKTSGLARRSWLLGRLAAKVVAARCWGTEPALVEVSKGPEGRPELNSPHGDDGGKSWQVSISHTVGAATSVVGAEPVGIDLERTDRVLNPRVVAWAFSPGELKILKSAQKFPGALSLWCAREAAAKSWGLGLLNHLDQVRVTEADWPLGRLVVNWLGKTPRRAEIKLEVVGDYLVTLATERKF